MPVAIFAWFAICPVVLMAGEPIAGHIVVKDALALPGKPVRIEAKLVRQGLAGTGLGGEPLEFSVGGTKVGTAMTGGDGRAFADYTCRLRGFHDVVVRLGATPRVAKTEGTGRLACWERRRPILLVDLATVVEPRRGAIALPGLPLPLLSSGEPKAMPDAAVELKRLSDYYYNVIYLDLSGDDDQVDREWLTQAGFPPGYVVAVSPGPDPLEAFLQFLHREGWDNVRAGVGSTRHFADVTLARRMETLVLPADAKEEDVPKKAHLIKDWKEVRKKLKS
ncbi:MAG: hypothetical protein A4S17_01395 [Proteobacteria bacterium HN_bin10]|nr:MAG: hypothetical protein A4S17_01395 [Proteobacteria bacterium HN_bin10]